MKLGIFAKTFEGSTPHRVLRAARDAGYEAVQYNMACSGLPSLPPDVPEEAADAVASAAEETGVAIAAVSATYNMAHPDAAEREKGRHSFEAIASAAQRMGTALVTVCTGSRDPQEQWRFHSGNESADAWQDMLSEFRHVVRIAERHGVLIGVEPELANIVSTPARARLLLDLFPSGPIRIVLDPANLFEQEGRRRVRDIISEAVQLVGPEVALAHAKDRKADGSFATAGQGVVDWDHYIATLRGAGYRGALVTHGLAASEAAGVAHYFRSKIGASRTC